MSATVIARRIIATPGRNASDAWTVIVDLLAPKDGDARRELESIAGVATTLIADDAFADAAAVVTGSGPRVRIYCLYGDDAISGDNKNENNLAFTATEGDWKMSLPCPVDDLNWVQETLKKKSSRITARDMTTTVQDEGPEQNQDNDVSKTAVVNREAFFRS